MLLAVNSYSTWVSMTYTVANASELDQTRHNSLLVLINVL